MSSMSVNEGTRGTPRGFSSTSSAGDGAAAATVVAGVGGRGMGACTAVCSGWWWCTSSPERLPWPRPHCAMCSRDAHLGCTLGCRWAGRGMLPQPDEAGAAAGGDGAEGCACHIRMGARPIASRSSARGSGSTSGCTSATTDAISCLARNSCRSLGSSCIRLCWCALCCLDRGAGTCAVPDTRAGAGGGGMWWPWACMATG
mmetsp:Transcript_12815/g.31414  ORF Transcript_12815/g.31414 Transcript_12815/m.31414 type:complete len:201 (-) Transcript_12815:1480-2082(-)